MLTVFTALVPVFLVTALGYLLKRMDFPGQSFWPAAERMTYYIFLPALLFHALATAHLAGPETLMMVVVLFAAIVLLSAILLALRPRLPINGPEFTSLFQGSMRFNGALGLAVAALLFGSPGVARLAVAIAVMVPLLNVLATLVLVRYANGGEARIGEQLRQVAQNPMVLACFAGIVVEAAHFRLPLGIGPMTAMLGAAAIPFALLVVGAAFDFGEHVFRASVLVTSVLKLLIFPLIVAALCWALGLHGLSRIVALLAAMLPPAPSTYILARALGGDARGMAATITLATIAAALTVPILLWLLG